MRHRIFILAMALLALSTSASAQLLYRISGNGLARPSYVMGTYHLAAKSFVDSIPGFYEALDNSAQVCGELVMAEMNNAEMAVKMQSAMLLPEGKTLKTLLKPDQLADLNALLRKLMGVDLSAPMVGEELGKLSPAALSTQLSLLMYSKVHPEASLEGIDTHVQNLAAEKGKKVMGVETVDDQIFVLFKSQTLERQLQMLMCMVKHQDLELQLAEQLVKAYYNQDIESIKEITDQKFNDECDSSEEEEEALIFGRNAKWVKAMPTIMGETPTFFVFGAAHLVGEKGVLQLLRNAGFTVEGMK